MTLKESDRVVVTGMGVMTPSGKSPDELWKNVKEGNSAAELITGLDVSEFSSRIGCQLSDFDPIDYIDPKRVRHMDRQSQLAIAAAQMAYKDAGFEQCKIDNFRFGVSEGTTLGGAAWNYNHYNILIEKGYSRLNPFGASAAFVGAASGDIAIDLSLKGPSLTVCNGCSAGADAIGLAMRAIQHKEADVMIAGGSDAPIVYPILAIFNRVRAMSVNNDSPKEACKPFDADRDGFVIGEGAAFLVLESEEHALKRGARIRGVLAGYGRSSDAYHVTAPEPDGESAAVAIQSALKDADMEPSQIDYINPHGTATKLNDSFEAKAINKALGPWGVNVMTSSTKPVTGHLQGASGAVEAAIVIMILENQIVPPNINLKKNDPECQLNIIKGQAKKAEINTVLSNSYGFGGKNASLIFTRYHS